MNIDNKAIYDTKWKSGRANNCTARRPDGSGGWPSRIWATSPHPRPGKSLMSKRRTIAAVISLGVVYLEMNVGINYIVAADLGVEIAILDSCWGDGPSVAGARSGGRWEHCSLECLRSLRRLLRWTGFCQVVIDKHSIDAEFNRNKMSKQLGSIGLFLLHLSNNVPSGLHPNFYRSAVK
jgi:hypothetical protein